jgi:L-ascorbate metabolism protein UlaG (beta-lactamase superfamily)
MKKPVGLRLASILLACTVSACVSVKDRPNENLSRNEISIQVSDEVVIDSWESAKQLWHPSSFRIRIEDKVIYIDPIDVIDPIPAVLILITHSHPDHLSPPDIEKLLTPETLIICPRSVDIPIQGARLEKLSPGESAEFEGFKIEAVPAYNFVHQKGFRWNGYIIESRGIRLYHAGDTGRIPEMEGLRDVTVAMVPIGVGILTMSPNEAASAIELIRPLIAVPMHYELETGTAELFGKLVGQGSRVSIMERQPNP